MRKKPSHATALLAEMILLHGGFNGDLALHQQLYNTIRDNIFNGSIAAGARVPASRRLATQLKLSRNTVIAAYDQLVAEGFLETRTGQGTFVCQLDLAQTPSERSIPDNKPNLNVSTRLLEIDHSLNKEFFLAGERLVPGLVDPVQFPYKQWFRLYQQHSRQIDNILPQYNSYNGYLPLCRALTTHLASTRGITADAQQVFITAGAPQALQLISKVLTDVGDVVVMEEPGYTTANDTLKFCDLKVLRAPVDHAGLSIDKQQYKHGNPRLLYATTSYQFPLGHTMPVQRRIELLNYAREVGAWIIEDDYDGEFRYKGKPIPSLFSLSNNQQTIYMGTFSKTLSLTLRCNFIVVPKTLVAYFQSVYPSFGNLSSMVTQATIADFISKGHFAKHIEQVRKLYAARRTHLEDCLYRYCNLPAQEQTVSPGGLHLTVFINAQSKLHPDTDSKIVEALRPEGVGCLPLSAHYQGPLKRQGFLLGFTSCDNNAIEAAIKSLQHQLNAHQLTLSYQ